MLEPIICCLLVYLFIGFIVACISKSDTDSDFVKMLLFYPLYLVFWIFKLIIKLFSLLFETVGELFTQLFESEK